MHGVSGVGGFVPLGQSRWSKPFTNVSELQRNDAQVVGSRTGQRHRPCCVRKSAVSSRNIAIGLILIAVALTVGALVMVSVATIGRLVGRSTKNDRVGR